jgi:hypothetical protein
MPFVPGFNQPQVEIERHEHPDDGPPALEPWKACMADLQSALAARQGGLAGRGPCSAGAAAAKVPA